jgi:DNA-binding MarR family transcriptional regulator
MLMNPPCNCISLRQATRRITQLYDQMLAPIGLRTTQLALLRTVARTGPIALNPLAEDMVVDRATLGHNVRPLEFRGLIRVTVGKDRRHRVVSLTKAGRALLAECHPLWDRAQEAFEDKLGAETAATLRSILHRVSATDFGVV